MNDIGKNSKLNKKQIQDTLQKHKIRNNTENIGFFDKITNIDDKIQMPENRVNKSELINFFLVFFYAK
jgi:hypothetical protein